MSCCTSKSCDLKLDVKLGESLTDDVKEYYGKTLKTSADLMTGACCAGSSKTPIHIAQAMKLIHTEVASRYYGCGVVLPEHLEETKVLDLGSGSGHDCFILSKLVGENGHVTGVDMTDEQLDVARKYIGYHTDTFGYKIPNVEFKKGYLEKLGEAGLQEAFYDIIISNCVINLCKDKAVVLKEAFRVLKEGGELYFSDVYADRVLSDDIRQHKLLWGECIAGALWWEELYNLADEVGFSQPRLVSASPIDVQAPELKQILGTSKFVSVTYRLFKLPAEKQEACNVMYDGTITGHPDSFSLDHYHTFPKDTVVWVDAEIATILHTSRFVEDFTFQSTQKKTSCSTTVKPNKINPFDWLDSNSNGTATSQGRCASDKPTSGSSNGCCASSNNPAKCC